MRTIKILTFSLVAALAACGGANKGGGTAGGGGGGGGGDVPPPPPPPAGGGSATQPQVVVSAEARDDYADAAKFFADTEKGNGWNDSTCAQSADNFSAVVREHKELADAQYMVGLSWHRCNKFDKAESAYQQALKINANHAQSLSNLGEIYYRQGKVSGARQYWTRAVQAYQKLIAARNNLASMILEDMKTTTDGKAWAQMDKDAQNHLSSVLAVDNDNIKAYTLYALVFMEGRKKNKNRLDLAKLLMDEADKRNPNYAPLRNARGLLYLYRNNLGQALKQFQAAVQLDPKFVEARMNVGLITLGFRSFDDAKAQFDAVLEIDPKNYDAKIGQGIALRGKGDLAGAEAAYKDATKIDGARADAYYNLGVLEKDFKATAVDNLDEARKHYDQAKTWFTQAQSKSGLSAADAKETKNNIEDCTKLMKQVDDFKKMQAAQAKMQADFEKSSGGDQGSAAGSGSGSGSATPPPTTPNK